MSLRPNSRVEIRKKNYKVGVDGEEARRKREENLVEIRRIKREDHLLKKRRQGPQQLQQPAQEAQSESERQCEFKRQLQNIPTLVEGVNSDDPTLQLMATTQFRKILAIERHPPIEEVVNAGVVPRFVEFLQWHHFPQLQFEAAWSLTNITSGTSDHTSHVIDQGALPQLVELLSSLNEDVREQAVWALANIAGDNIKSRDLIFSHGALDRLIAQLNGDTRISMLRNVTWALSNLFSGKPPPAFVQIKTVIPALVKLIRLDDEEILQDACWALSHISDGTNERIQAVIESDVCGRLVELMLHNSSAVVVPALRTAGNIVTGDDIQTQVIIDNGILPCLLSFLTNVYKKSVKKEACWAISNITAGNRNQKQAVIDANIIPSIVQVLQHSEFDIKKEAAWAITNATSGASDDQIKYLVKQGCIKSISDLLLSPDRRLVIVSLDALQNILESGKTKIAGLNLYAQIVDDVGGLENIERLQSDKNNEICEKAVRIRETFWPDHDEGDQDITSTAFDDNEDYSDGW